MSAFLRKSRRGAPFSTKDIQMPTPLSLGFDIKYQPAHHRSLHNGDERSLVVVAGWMGAKERQLKPYLNFYHSHGIDTLSFAVGPNHVLFPNTAEKHMIRVLKAAKNPHDVDRRPLKHLLFHHFSVGGFLYGQMLRTLTANASGHADILDKIKAQVFDSPPDFRGIAKGVSRSMGVGPPMSTAIELGLRAYLSATESTSGAGHRLASEAFHDNHITAPSLWYYSKADPVASWEDCETVIGKWRAKGTRVEQCIWEDTPHIQHGRHDPERYFGTLHSFLIDTDVLPPHPHQ
jgi:hypothetical protein